jgi:archaeoflavoprotein AfpA
MSAKKVRRVAWGITGSGDDIKGIMDAMRTASERYPDVGIRVFLSKSGEQVQRMYLLYDELVGSFPRVQTEKTPNTPFLAGELQSLRYDFFIIAPTTSNTTAKISLGLGDSLISNAVSMATKVSVPVYVLPCEYGEGSTQTTLPDGSTLNLRIRERDAEHIRELDRMKGVFVIKSPQEILEVFDEHYS